MSTAPPIPAAPLRRSRPASVRRGLAMLLLPASIVPVPFLGASLLRAPEKLTRQTGAAVERLMAPAPHPPREWLVTRAPAELPGLSPEVRRGAARPRPHDRTPR